MCTIDKDVYLGDRRDFWNTGHNPITGFKPVKKNYPGINNSGYVKLVVEYNFKGGL